MRIDLDKSLKDNINSDIDIIESIIIFIIPNLN